MDFDRYKGGIMTCDSGPLCNIPKYTDHVIIIAGFGVDPESGLMTYCIVIIDLPN